MGIFSYSLALFCLGFDAEMEYSSFESMLDRDVVWCSRRQRFALGFVSMRPSCSWNSIIKKFSALNPHFDIKNWAQWRYWLHLVKQRCPISWSAGNCYSYEPWSLIDFEWNFGLAMNSFFFAFQMPESSLPASSEPEILCYLILEKLTLPYLLYFGQLQLWKSST